MRRLTTLALLAAAVVMIGAPAYASCAEPPPIEEGFAQSDAVFTGTVVRTEFDGRLAHVEVTHVWKGNVTARTEVAGSFELSPNLFTSVDRTYRLTDYVFFVRTGDTGFEDDICTLTRPAGEVDESRLAELAAGGDYVPRLDPDAPAEDGGSAAITLAAVGVAGLVALATGAVSVRRRGSRASRSGT
jgi:hypothetical protein